MLTAARARADEVGVVPIGNGGGAALCFVAAAIEARAVVEIGTGTGVSGVWMLRGMRADGVLTTVDLEAEHQRLAKQAFTEAGVAPQRVRLIPGAALDVLPRLTDGHYDLVFCDVDDYEERLASKVADADNAAGPPGAITAALFLRHFAGGLPWAHIDIASVGDAPKDEFEYTKGATGFGARALLHWLELREPLAGIGG